MAWILYNFLFAVVFACLLPHFLLRMKRRGGYRRNFGQRLGVYDPALRQQLEAGNWIWLHAVSVGEVFVALRTMEEFRKGAPEQRFVLTVTTSTGHRIAEDKLPRDDILLYFPVDFPPVMRGVLDLINPRLILLVECEMWPNLIRLATDRGIPVALINGRMSDSSFRGYSRVRWMTRRVLPRLSACCMQGPRDGDRITRLGAPPERVHVTGTAKYDVAERDPASEELARGILGRAGIGPDRLVLMGGSTWAGEERVLVDVYARLKTEFPALCLVLAPRHVERRDEIERLLQESGRSWLRRSSLDDDGSSSAPDILFIDTTGELKHLYACADVIFVGKSLTFHGGQNVIEPALYGKAILTGPNMENFPLVMEHFREAEALIQVADADGLNQAVRELLGDPAKRDLMGSRAAGVVRDRRGSVAQTLEILNPFLPR